MIVVVSAQDLEALKAAVEANPPRVCVISPTAAARETAAAALNGRYAFIAVEPLLAPRAPEESGDDVIARLVQAFRVVQAYGSDRVLVVLDSVDILGAGAFSLDDTGLMSWADRLARLLPLP